SAPVTPAASSARRMRRAASVSASTWAISIGRSQSTRKNQFPPQATSPRTRPSPATSTSTPRRWRRLAPLSTATRPSAPPSAPATRGVDEGGAGPHPSQGAHGLPHADRSVAGHPQRPDVVEEDRAGGARRIGGRNEQGPHDHVRAARLAHHGGAEVVVLAAEAL